MASRNTNTMYYVGGGIGIAGVAVASVIGLPDIARVSYSPDTSSTFIEAEEDVATSTASMPEPAEPRVITIETPEEVKALYMTQCVAGTPSMRRRLVSIAESTEVNALMIDIKDYTGTLAFEPHSEKLKPYFGTHCYAPDMREFIRMLNEKDIYVIGRITVFQDPLWAKRNPEYAVKAESTGKIWTDNNGLHFVDVGAEAFWDYIVTLSEDAARIGFDELNYDYIRYPSDGDMQDIQYPISEARVNADSVHGKAEQVRDFFAYLKTHTDDLDIATSADLFGMVTTNPDDLNIGQILEYALPYFDYIAPMVYPSHYPPGFNGWSDPNDYPHEVIEHSMTRAVERTRVFKQSTSTPAEVRTHVSVDQLRPWIQDFDYGGNYGAKEVRAQIEAVYDSGLDSWMIWDPANRYTIEALEKAKPHSN